MGSPKMLLPFGRRTVLQTVLDTVQECGVEQITLVLGWHQEAIRASLDTFAGRIVLNPHPDEGMLSSVQCALRAETAPCDAYLLVLGDQPQIRKEAILSLRDAFVQGTKSLYLPVFEGKRGHPLLLSAQHRDAILALPVSGGLNNWIRQRPQEVQEVPLSLPEVLEDVDTPEEYRNALRAVSLAPPEETA